eukprot:TRINITY_DN7406_c0_g1_i1.p1 TRINITY_DN7406_c0_g1~~TRINITY_DN7406_c0_g1_i1.p1  ORF type:complete len:332 (+),score=60.10 TRINITY_DN7406_c0_g1_i1:95-1090(+)
MGGSRGSKRGRRRDRSRSGHRRRRRDEDDSRTSSRLRRHRRRGDSGGRARRRSDEDRRNRRSDRRRSRSEGRRALGFEDWLKTQERRGNRVATPPHEVRRDAPEFYAECDRRISRQQREGPQRARSRSRSYDIVSLDIPREKWCILVGRQGQRVKEINEKFEVCVSVPRPESGHRVTVAGHWNSIVSAVDQIENLPGMRTAGRRDGAADWQCPSCKFRNFASRSACKECRRAKDGNDTATDAQAQLPLGSDGKPLPTPEPTKNPRKLCRLWRKGMCQGGAGCSFSHTALGDDQPVAPAAPEVALKNIPPPPGMVKAASPPRDDASADGHYC